jgi:hypothetical protein
LLRKEKIELETMRHWEAAEKRKQANQTSNYFSQTNSVSVDDFENYADLISTCRWTKEVPKLKSFKLLIKRSCAIPKRKPLSIFILTRDFRFVCAQDHPPPMRKMQITLRMDVNILNRIAHL